MSPEIVNEAVYLVKTAVSYTGITYEHLIPKEVPEAEIEYFLPDVLEMAAWWAVVMNAQW